MHNYFKVSAKNSWEHPCPLKLGTWKVSKKALISKSFSSDTMLTQKISFKTKQHFVNISFLEKWY